MRHFSLFHLTIFLPSLHLHLFSSYCSFLHTFFSLFHFLFHHFTFPNFSPPSYSCLYLLVFFRLSFFTLFAIPSFLIPFFPSHISLHRLIPSFTSSISLFPGTFLHFICPFPHPHFISHCLLHLPLTTLHLITTSLVSFSSLPPPPPSFHPSPSSILPAFSPPSQQPIPHFHSHFLSCHALHSLPSLCFFSLSQEKRKGSSDPLHCFVNPSGEETCPWETS